MNCIVVTARAALCSAAGLQEGRDPQVESGISFGQPPGRFWMVRI